MKVKIKKCGSLCEFNPFWTFFLPQNRPTVILSNFIEKNKCSPSDDFENCHVQNYMYSPNGRFLVQETFPKTLPRFVLILISLQRWQHRARNETKHFVSPHLIGPQLHQLDFSVKIKMPCANEGIVTTDNVTKTA